MKGLLGKFVLLQTCIFAMVFKSGRVTVSCNICTEQLILNLYQLENIVLFSPLLCLSVNESKLRATALQKSNLLCLSEVAVAITERRKRYHGSMSGRDSLGARG